MSKLSRNERQNLSKLLIEKFQYNSDIKTKRWFDNYLIVKEDKRFIQTGIGWVLSDMSKKYPIEVEATFRKYIKELSKEVIDRHSKYLDSHQELKKLKR